MGQTRKVNVSYERLNVQLKVRVKVIDFPI